MTPILHDGIKYKSAHDFAKAFGLSPGTVSGWLKKNFTADMMIQQSLHSTFRKPHVSNRGSLYSFIKKSSHDEKLMLERIVYYLSDIYPVAYARERALLVMKSSYIKDHIDQMKYPTKSEILR